MITKEEKFTIKKFLIRWHRRKHNLCVYCGIKMTSNHWFCSIECVCYDGSYSVTKGWLRKPSLFIGRIGSPKQRGWL